MRKETAALRAPPKAEGKKRTDALGGAKVHVNRKEYIEIGAIPEKTGREREQLGG